MHWSRLDGNEWSSPKPVSGPSAWNPEAATDSAGNLWIAWDSYRNGNFDVFLARVSPSGEIDLSPIASSGADSSTAPGRALKRRALSRRTSSPSPAAPSGS